MDACIFPVITTGGVVMPSDPAAIHPPHLGQENDNAKSKQARPATRSWARSEGRQGPAVGDKSSIAGRSWTPHQAASLIRAGVSERYDDQVNKVVKAYPGARVWHQDNGCWILVESSILSGLQRQAVFLVAISNAGRFVRGWGFWGSIVGVRWIGPRHTNFPDGSICAFEPADDTWQFGDSLVELMDFYTLWALRHLFLETFGRWPGPQAVSRCYERLLELKGDELCGCDRSGMSYAGCCQPHDLARNRIADAVNFFFFTQGKLRSPPNSVVRFARDRKEPPHMTTLFDC